MTDRLESRLLLHLRGSEAHQDGDRVPWAYSTPGVCEAVGAGRERVADRFKLLAALSELSASGLVTATTRDVVDLGEQRNVHLLTEEGVAAARQRRESVAAESVTLVEDGRRHETTLGAAADHPEVGSLAAALARRTADGCLYLDDDGAVLPGRDGELDRFDAVLDAATAGTAETLVVTGPGGVGKSALLSTVAERAAERGFAVREGRCRREVDRPYGPFQPFLPETDDAADVDVDDEDALDARRMRLFEAVADRLSAGGPRLVVVDDMQWADDPTLALFEYLSRARPDARLALVGAVRSDVDGSRPAVLDADSVTAMALDPLSEADTARLAADRLDVPAVPDAFASVLHDGTGGNPGLAVETLDRLVADGRLDPDHDMYPDAVDYADAGESARAAVERRLGALDDDVRTVVRTAAVLGRSTPVDVLSAVVDVDRQAVLDYVDLLAEGGVWDLQDGTVTFRSGLLRSALESAVDDERARVVHREAAATLADRADAADRYAAVAHHYEQAGETDAALSFYVQAGTRARNVYAHEVAIDNYRRALPLARDDGAWTNDLLRALGDTHLVVGNYGDARKHFRYVRERADDPAVRLRMDERRAAASIEQGGIERAADLAEQALDSDPDDDVLRAELHVRLGLAARELGDYDRATTAFETARDLASAADDRSVLGAAHHHLGGVALYRGALDDAEQHLQRAVDLRSEADDIERSKSYNNLGVVASYRGDLEGARRYYEQSLAIDREVGDLWSLSLTLNNLGNLHRNLGDLEAARAHYRESIETARKTDDSYALASALGNDANLDMYRGDLDRAQRRHERRLEIESDVGRERGVGISHKNLGHVQRYAGNHGQALDHYETAIERLTAIGEGRQVAGARAGLALSTLALEGPAAARPHAEQAVEAADAADDAQMQARSRRAAARVALAADDAAAALAHVDAADEALSGTANEFERPRNRYDRGRVCLARGDVRAGRAHLRAARAAFADSDMTPWVERCDQELIRFEGRCPSRPTGDS